MAWFRAMGAAEVAYHEATVLGREDDHPGRALDYYGSRGETPLRWGGAGAARLGLHGEVTPDAYEKAYGVGGFTDPGTGQRLVSTTRPGFELVVGAHKSVAMLGVTGEANAMHSILDAETSATMTWLDDWFQDRGGRRGRAQTRTSTGGLVFASTRHATSRAGDPSPHDHVLVANVAEMLDGVAGHKALDSAALRDTVEAATMVGRLASAATAVELGFEIEPDDGASGRLRHWRISGVPAEVCELFSKRSDEISEHLAETGHDGPRARGVAARQTRKAKRHTGTDDLMPGWHAELAAAGWPLPRLQQHLDQARRRAPALPLGLTDAAVDRLTGDVLSVDGDLLRNRKVFTRTNLIAEVAPRLYGRHPAELDKVIGRILANQEVVGLLRVAGAREPTFTTAAVLVAEHSIALAVETLADQPGPTVTSTTTADAIAARETSIGRRLTGGQRAAVEAICGSGRAVEVIVGVAGSGKTTAVDAAARALEASGYRVIGASTSGQAVRTLGEEAGIEARTLASLTWRIDRDQTVLDERTVVVVDEAGMTADADLARLALGVERAGATLVLVGDHRQLDAVGPGGALRALLERRPDLVTTLADNVRQHDPGERQALAQLRDGSVPDAVAWYARHDRIHPAQTRTGTLVAMADAWVADTTGRHSTALLAWRRQDVADLNRLARRHRQRQGQLTGPELTAPGGNTFTAGDRIIALRPNRPAGLVTSQQLTVTAVDTQRQTITAATVDGRTVTLTGDEIDAGHLDYGYALTVHRAQGATYDRAHVLAAGGGRELAYVALSRARRTTTIHTTADDQAQAVDDLQADWGVERHQRWITPPTHHAPPPPNGPPPPSRLADLLAAAAPAPTPSKPTRAELEHHVRALRRDLDDLGSGAGRWAVTPEGEAAIALNRAEQRARQARARLEAPHLKWRHRRSASREDTAATAAAHDARAVWQTVGAPIEGRLEADLVTAERSLQAAHTANVKERLEHFGRRPRRGHEPTGAAGPAKPSLEASRRRGLGR